MPTLSSFAIISLAALVHAGLQLSVGTLTLMSAHRLGARARHEQLMVCVGGFIAGALLTTLLALACFALVLYTTFSNTVPRIAWAMASGLLVGLGLVTWIFLYRRQKGSAPWIPRPIASYLASRASRTHSGIEAFALGSTSVFGEVVFILGPVVIGALVVADLAPHYQLHGLVLYTIVASLPLATVAILIGGGKNIASIQRWRESNRRFLQFTTGCALLALGFYVYIDKVMWPSIALHGGV